MSFTKKHIQNKQLIINMLQFEDTIIHSEFGKSIYDDNSYEHFTNLEAMYAIHRYVLKYFNFHTNEDNIENYRKIFSYYYKSPTDYDKDVILAVSYMRENELPFCAKREWQGL